MHVRNFLWLVINYKHVNEKMAIYFLEGWAILSSICPGPVFQKTSHTLATMQHAFALGAILKALQCYTTSVLLSSIRICLIHCIYLYIY